MKKPNPTVLGKMRCQCGDEMEVRQRSNGKKLLYTYCPTCKQDMRSGEGLQRFWRENMVPLDSTLPPLTETSTNQDDLSSTPQPNAEASKTDSKTDLAEWRPETNESDDNSTGGDSGGFLGWFLGGVVTVSLVVLGVKVARAG